MDIVVLAGYMKKIGPKTLAHFQGRILNIHPALLPKYGGQDFAAGAYAFPGNVEKDSERRNHPPEDGSLTPRIHTPGIKQGDGKENLK